jgi:ABC-2 type transport system permease protein
MMVMSVVRLLIGMVPVSLLAIGFFGFNPYGMGLALAAFLILTSWAVGVLVSGALPPTYVFEGMRGLLIDHQFRTDLEAFFMNVVLFAAGVTGFMLLLWAARRHGSLMQTGE